MTYKESAEKIAAYKERVIRSAMENGATAADIIEQIFSLYSIVESWGEKWEPTRIQISRLFDWIQEINKPIDIYKHSAYDNYTGD